MQNSDLKSAQKLINNLKKQMESLQNDRQLEPWERVSAAVGLAVYDDTKDETVDDVFKRADKSMYENKKAMKAVRTD